MKVKRFVMEGGERHAVLIGNDSLPMIYPNLYITIHCRNKNLRNNSIIAVLEDIKFLYELLEHLGIRLEERLHKQNFLEINEIEVIASKCCLQKKEFSNQSLKPKVISFPRNKERLRVNFVVKNVQVSSGFTYRRLTNFANYIKWLERYFNPRLKTESHELLLERRPHKNVNEVASEYKSFDSDQLKIILEIIENSKFSPSERNMFFYYRKQLIIYLLLYLGCRKGELLNIKLTDIVPIKSAYKVVQIDKGHQYYINIKAAHNDPKDTRLNQPVVKTKNRSIGLNIKLKAKIDHYILNIRSAISNVEYTDFLLVTDDGKPLSISALDKILSELSKETGFNIHAHAFRHTWNDIYTVKAQELIQLNRINEAQAENDRCYLMGWMSGSNSARRYARRAEEGRAIEMGLVIQDFFEGKHQ
ncbi:tyrosine-type recombinase/integrase [Acinetobacter baumannii]|uniref:tyrosine-type recombinase/integrase n=1 Tax=Acinetobacter baumannii TaxID=470 RepID=UPI003AF8DA42